MNVFLYIWGGEGRLAWSRTGPAKKRATEGAWCRGRKSGLISRVDEVGIICDCHNYSEGDKNVERRENKNHNAF